MRSPLSSPPPPPAAAGAMSPDGSCRGRQLLGYLRVVVACQHAAHAAPGGQCHMVAQQRLPVSQSLPSRAVAVRRPFRVPLARRCSRTTWRASSWNWSPRQRASRTASCPLLHTLQAGDWPPSIEREKKMLVAGTTDRSFGLEWARLAPCRVSGIEVRSSSISTLGRSPHRRTRAEMPLVPSSAIFVDNIPSRRPKRIFYQREIVPLLLILYPPCFCSLILRPVIQCCLGHALYVCTYSRKVVAPPAIPLPALPCGVHDGSGYM